MSGPGYLHPFLPGVIYANGAGEEIRTLAELKMNYFSYWVRSQPDWWLTFKNEDTAARWRATARREDYLQDALTLLGPIDNVENAMDPRGPRYALYVLMAAPVLTEGQIDWMLDELSDFAARVSRDDVQPSCFDRIWQGHQLPTELVSSISMDLDRLYKEELPISQDASGRFPLVHPHNHPLIYGRTLVREHKLLGEKGSCTTFIRAEPPYRRNNFYNLHSTFLPTTFHVPDRATDSLLAESYINGIPPFPSHHVLRNNILELLHRAVPLFENVLTDLHRHNTAFIRPRIRDGYGHTNAHEAPPERPGQIPGDTTDDEQDEDAWFDYRWRLSCWEASRKVILPDLPKGGYICNKEKRGPTRISLRGKSIQVVLEVVRDVVSLSQSPIQKPWGVVGRKNDSIVASSVMVLESRNVTGGPISFRAAVTQSRHASDDKAAQQTWGMSSLSPKCQILGLVPLELGRPVAWPNIYQHCILPPSLVDTTVPGYRILLFFHLVDPETPILSTTVVPPQQVVWMRRALLENLDQRLPVEIVEQILRDAVETGCILDEAESKVICADLTLQGEGFASWMNQMYFEIPFI